MKDILETIVAHKRKEVEQMKEAMPERELCKRAEKSYADLRRPSLARALATSSTGIIAEFKRKSPSKGWIREEAKVEEVALAYQRGGAAALSILTDNEFFGGSDAFITAARQAGVTLPVLYKNFVIDRYQLFRACLCGASAVLLIASCLTHDECARLAREAHSLGLEVLLEMHSEEELCYADCDVDLFGINNRHLGTFATDVSNSFRLATLLPEGTVKVSESGISAPSTVRDLRRVGYRGFLIGEYFMRQEAPGQALSRFVSAVEEGRNDDDRESMRDA